MKEYKVETIFQLMAVSRNEYLSFFRGLSDSEYKLIPKVGRLIKKAAQTGLPQLLMGRFKKESSCYLSQPPSSEWGWLAVAQHYGLATHLMDWSSNPLVAAFFAVEKDSPKDAAVYAFKSDDLDLVDINKHSDPYKLRKVYIFHPNYTTHRIKVQKGLFTFHPDPTKEFRCPSLVKFILNGKSRLWLRDELDDFGFNRSVLFPDLQGLAESLNTLLFDMPRVIKELAKNGKRKRQKKEKR